MKTQQIGSKGVCVMAVLLTVGSTGCDESLDSGLATGEADEDMAGFEQETDESTFVDGIGVSSEVGVEFMPEVVLLPSEEVDEGGEVEEDVGASADGQGRRSSGIPIFEGPFGMAPFFSDDGSDWRADKYPRFMSDVNGDGLVDIVGFSQDSVFVSLSQGSRFEAPRRWTNGFTGRLGWSVDRHPRIMADVNGDGRSDIVGFANNGVYVGLAATGVGFHHADKWVDDFGYVNGGWRTERHLRMLADVDGDGLPDIVGFGDGGVLVSRSTGSDFTEPEYWSNSYGYNAGGWRVDRHPRFMADVNRDGRADIVGFGHRGVYVSTSTGSGFTQPRRWIDAYGAVDGWNTSRHPRILADVNGDDRADIVGFDDDGVYVSLSSGSRFTTPRRVIAGMGYEAGSWRVDKHPRLVQDIDGDKKADIVAFGHYGVWVSRSLGGSYETPRLWVDAFGVDEDAGGWRVDKHPRGLADIDGDGLVDVYGFGQDDTYVGLHWFR